MKSVFRLVSMASISIAFTMPASSGAQERPPAGVEIVAALRGIDARCALEVSIPSADVKFPEKLKVAGSTFKVVAQVHTKEKEKECISPANPAKMKVILKFHAFVKLKNGKRLEGFARFEISRDVVKSPDIFSFDSDDAGLKLTDIDILNGVLADAAAEGGAQHEGEGVVGNIKLTVEAQVFETGKCACSDGASFFIAKPLAMAAKGNHACVIELTIRSVRVFKVSNDAVEYTFRVQLRAEKKGSTDTVRFTAKLATSQKYKCDGAIKESAKESTSKATGALNPAEVTIDISAAFLKKVTIEGKECDIVLTGNALSFSLDCTVEIVQSGETADWCSDFAHADGTADPSKEK
ncbi:MAG: hypothetical protein HYY17_01105 [Planctomycetes bacterium]|nr:hypothetical protein [Planctomycetota bacterium]